jgi:DNA helicase HerA-like ATPase
LGNGNVTSEIKLVTFTAHTGELRRLPWKPAEVLARPKPGEIVITSACRSSSDRRVIGLGYISSEMPQDIELRDPSGVFRNISQAHTPIYDGQKLRPRVAW